MFCQWLWRSKILLACSFIIMILQLALYPLNGSQDNLSLSSSLQNHMEDSVKYFTELCLQHSHNQLKLPNRSEKGKQFGWTWFIVYTCDICWFLPSCGFFSTFSKIYILIICSKHQGAWFVMTYIISPPPMLKMIRTIAPLFSSGYRPILHDFSKIPETACKMIFAGFFKAIKI